jgi:hypothetical protein
MLRRSSFFIFKGQVEDRFESELAGTVLAAPELVPGTGQGVLPMRRRIGINDMFELATALLVLVFVAVTLVVGPLYLERRLAKTFVIPTIEQSQLATIAR